jgi:subtilisin-like proprotein convertase family protein
MSEETARVDAASAVGIRISPEIDPVDPSRVRCTVDWLSPSEEATISVLGPASVTATTLPESGAETGSRWSSDVVRVDAGDRSELLLELAPNSAAQPVMVLVERRDGSVILQAGVSLAFDGATTEASAQTSFRVRHEALEAGQGAVIVEHLGPPSSTKAQIFAEDSTNHSIDDGPTDCSPGSTVWPLTTFLSVSSAPAAATASAVTVHLTVIHPVMANLQIVFSKEFFTVARFLWNNGAGVNLDQDFTTDVYSHTLPGVGEPVNGTWVLALRDCTAGNTGILDYWSVRIEYSAAPTIDLAADSLSTDPATVEAGDTIEVDWAGHVAGTGTVGGPFTVGFYLSTDTNVTTGDVLLGQVVESSAQNPSDTFGQSSPGRMLTIPGGTADGTYYLGMIVDSADVVSETNETNNVAWSQLTVAAAASTIDLVADEVGIPISSVAAGESFQISYAGHATGGGTIAGNFSLGFYLSTDASITAGDLPLAHRVGAWATTGGDAFGAMAYTVTVPPATPAGTYYVGFWVDDTDVVAESDETNNKAVNHPLVVTTGGGGQANLAAMPCTVTPVVAEAGDTLNLTWRGLNNGTAGSGAFTWGIYLSVDGTIDPTTDTLLTEQSVTTWAAGTDTGTRWTAITLPAGLADGLYRVGLVLDTESTVAESDESDNSCKAQLMVGSTTAPAAVTRWLVPAAASAPGFGTSNWKSQVSVVNPVNATRSASLYFVASGAPWPGVLLSGPMTISPNDRFYFDDVLASLNPAAGLLYVVLDDIGPVVTSRTYNLEPGGATFGQGIPAIPFEGITPPNSVVLPMVHTEPGRFHTNLGLVHAAGGNLQVQVQVYNAAGSLIGTKSYSQSAAWRQINDLFTDMGLGDQVIYGGWLRVTRDTGAGFWTCYASVVDDLTNDPTYVAPMEVATLTPP